MWRTTKDPMWRDYGWAIWEAIEEKTRTPSGYTSVQGVDQADPWGLDSMPRFVPIYNNFITNIEVMDAIAISSRRLSSTRTSSLLTRTHGRLIVSCSIRKHILCRFLGGGNGISKDIASFNSYHTQALR
jgi:hypothetical protein